VNEEGKVAGVGGSKTEIPGTEALLGPAMLPAVEALEKWQFKPLIRDGKPQYFSADIIFVGK